MFYENYVRLCNSVNKSPSAVALEIGIAKPTVSRWKSGSVPNTATLLKVSDYFGVSVADLTEEKEKPLTNGEGLDAETIELREIWDSADQEEREALLAMAKMLKARRTK